jgi:hypothetical protein
MTKRLFSGLLVLASAFPVAAHAYIGPGAGLGAIGLTIALIVGLVLLVVGFVWYPLKRFLRGRKTKIDSASSDKTSG